MKKILLFVLLICVLFACGCAESDNSQTVKTGDYVSVNYTGSLEDGTVFDTSRADIAMAENLYNPYRSYEPLPFIAGSGQMIKGFDDAVMGMAVGEKKTVTILPEDGYGAYCPELLIPVPVDEFQSANITPVIGQKVTYQSQPVTIVNISEENVTLDCNHNLAGKTLIFDIELVSIEKA